MRLCRRIFGATAAERTAGALARLYKPGFWIVEAGCEPPPSHRPAGLLRGMAPQHRMAVSLRTATLLGLLPADAMTEALGIADETMNGIAGLALHEMLVNAAVHGNLQVETGAASTWQDMSVRERMIEHALGDPVRANRVVTVAAGRETNAAYAVIADEGEGYVAQALGEAAASSARRGAGRGMLFARAAARVDVLRGGRCVRLTFPRGPSVDAS
jgi:hypothetical protein